ncbi:MAG: hypothetical protein ACTSXD_11690 [Candidatus Heimdallarchaeaceae archaeon]
MDKIIILKKYCEKRKSVHITLVNDRFYNGRIVEINEEEELLIFNDDKLGELFISFNEIALIEPFKEKKNG